MLTEQERAWLERRKSPCLHCSNHGVACGYSLSEKATCEWLDLDVDEPDYKDAAEFEARVAALLSTREFRWLEYPCEYGDDMCHHISCPPGKDHAEHRLWCRRWCKLKIARLMIEKEMEEL